jgi:PIN domain nuclease of toxin-antitoxin system
MDIYLIDTHVFIWLLYKPEKLPSAVISLLEEHNQNILLSKASIWEMFLKLRKGNLRFHKPLRLILDEIMHNQLLVIEDILIRDLERISELTTHHNDPFDHMLIAQAINRNIPIITADQHFRNYPVNVLWD